MGTVKRVEYGWPNAVPKFEIALPSGPVRLEVMAFLNVVTGSRAFQERCYARPGELWDVDVRTTFNVRDFLGLVHQSYQAGAASFDDSAWPERDFEAFI